MAAAIELIACITIGVVAAVIFLKEIYKPKNVKK
jgi:hypothetical protein